MDNKDIELKEKNIKKENNVTYVTIFLSTLLLTPAVSLLFGKDYGEVLRNTVLSGLFSLFLIFIFIYEFYTGHFDNDNGEHIYRFLIAYEASLILVLCFPLIDQAGWPFIAIAVTISVFSNPLIGMYSLSGLLMISCLLTPSADLITFVVYFLASLFAIVVINATGDTQNNIAPILISVIPMFILETAGFILLKNENLSAEQFIMPIVNICINTILLFWILKFYNENVRNIYKYKYQELNDQEYSQLIKLKEKSKTEYFRSIHTAYLTERMALSTGCDVDVAKNLAYYHRIKKVFNYSMSDVKRFVVDNKFPPEAAQALLDFYDKNKELTAKEACLVYISDKFISSLMVLFEKDNKIVIDYDSLIDQLFNSPSINKELNNCDLSRKDFNVIKDIMKQETLYYDFLR